MRYYPWPSRCRSLWPPAWPQAMLLTPHAWVSETPFGSEGLSSLREEPGASLGVLRSKRAPACLEQHLLLGGTGPCSPESAVLKPGGGRGAQKKNKNVMPSRTSLVVQFL